jgi:hypothetical protein
MTRVIKVTIEWDGPEDELAEQDVPAFESYIRERLAFLVKQREERQERTENSVDPG